MPPLHGPHRWPRRIRQLSAVGYRRVVTDSIEAVSGGLVTVNDNFKVTGDLTIGTNKLLETTGNTPSLNLMAKSRINWDNANNRYQFQYFDDEGILQTNTWGSLAELWMHTDTNSSELLVGSVTCDDIGVTNNVSAGSFSAPTVTATTSMSSPFFSGHIKAPDTGGILFKSNAGLDLFKVFNSGTVLCNRFISDW